MNLKKILGLSVIGLLSIFMAGMNVKAANSDSVTLTCDKTTIKIGESTVCTVVATNYFTTATDAPSAATVTISPSKYLTVSAVTSNSTLGWAKTNETSSNGETTYSFSNSNASSNITTGKQYALMSFTVTLNQEAKTLTDTTNCAQICISGATFNGNILTSESFGTCPNPTAVIEDCTGSECSAKTGAFLNYSLLCGGAFIALIAILVARKRNKFYRI